MSQLNVLVLTTSFPVTRESVNGIFVKRLLLAMPDGVNVTVLAPAGPGSDPQSSPSRLRLSTFRYAPRRWQTLALGPGGIPVALRRNPLLYLLVPLFLVSMFVKLSRLAKNAQVIHANWAVCGFVGGLVAALRGIPLVTTLRGEDLNSADRSAVHRFLVRRTLSSSERVVTVSTAFEDRVREAFPKYADKCQTIPNGVGQAFIDVGSRRQELPPDDRAPLRLIAAGSLIPRKGMDVILRALGKLADPRAVHLDVIGNGAELGSLKSLAHSLQLEERVNFRGEVAADDMPAALSTGAVFILASHSEGRPNVILEAKAAGLAVVASRIDGVTEIVKDGADGLLFDDNADDQLAVHLQYLCDRRDEVRRLGMSAHRSIVDAGLTWPASALRYASLYHQTIMDRRS